MLYVVAVGCCMYDSRLDSGLDSGLGSYVNSGFDSGFDSYLDSGFDSGLTIAFVLVQNRFYERRRRPSKGNPDRNREIAEKRARRHLHFHAGIKFERDYHVEIQTEIQTEIQVVIAITVRT